MGETQSLLTSIEAMAYEPDCADTSGNTNNDYVIVDPYMRH
jgi:hypothetical protein